VGDASVTGLYDSEGVLRFAGRDQADCLAYAELFGLDPSHYCLSPLVIRQGDERGAACV
jgi:hypothetical protein